MPGIVAPRKRPRRRLGAVGGRQDRAQAALMVSLVIPKLDRQAHQMTLRWDNAAFAALDTSPSLRLIRAARAMGFN